MSDDTTTLKPAGPTLSLLEGSPMSLVGPTGRPDSPGQGLSAPAGATGAVTAPGPELVNVTIDGRPLQFPKGTNLLEACNEAGANVPYFCYHPGLSAPAVCRQCLVDVKGQPKPVPSCYTPVADKMEVTTASPRVLDIRRQMLEFTLLNHPIDCPICDKAGECSLQKHYFDWDAKYARNDGLKVEKAKAVDIGQHIVLDQERCILCSRCIRVCNEVAKQPELTMAMRGDHEVLTTAPGRRLDNPYSLNTVDVCPVGALTSKDFRFASRAWELTSTPSVCPGCSTGCNVEVHSSRDVVKRLVPRPNEKVNKYWMCDEGRFTYKRTLNGRLGVPSVAGVPTEWDAALDAAAAKLRAVLDVNPASVGVVFSAQSTNEDLYVAANLAFDHLGLKRAYLAGRDQGWHDDILVSADRNPNTAGAIAVGAGRLKSLLDLSQDLKKGELKALLIIGEDGVLAGDNAAAALPLGGLETLVVLAWNRDALVEQANVALPLAAWTEVDGTFTNKQGFVQRIRPATPAVGDSLPTWEVLGHLGRRLGQSKDFSSARAVFLEAKQTLPFMKEADWGKTSLPVHLRFANSRG